MKKVTSVCVVTGSVLRLEIRNVGMLLKKTYQTCLARLSFMFYECIPRHVMRHSVLSSYQMAGSSDY